uniref:ATP binding cassette subfamily A member 5 n=1 Tax=Oreochromis niloticus TaxID=8128 RepID=A0A669CJC5_ORENI
MDSSATSYKLRFPHNQLPLPSDYTESIASCLSSSVNCRAANYWYSGFIHLQSLIDAAIIQMQTKRSVLSELELKAVMMGQPGSVEVQKFPHALISIYLVLAFTPFVTFLIVNVAAEKEHRLKDTMTMMGLYDTAFWLSWGLLYAALVTTMSILMAIIATCGYLIPAFPLVWLLCLLSPSAFSIGIAQVVYLEAQGDGAVFSSLTNGPHPLYVPLLMLVVDCILYLLLAIYLDQVLPGEFGMRRSLVYFLKPSYWSKRRKRYVEVSSVYDTELNGAPGGDESIEPVSPEFRGKEAIRINNIRKVYKEKDNVVEALRGLTFDIYEGQITALLGHSGAGKSTLMNILCGICPPTNGTATIYGSPVAEIADASEMKQLVGICPQFNIIFDVLTVEEHLRIFAAIKGIPRADIDTEVTKVLKDLDLEKIMTAQAKNLSGGQKRKLSVGIAILGDPKILLLDEPTAGMDPYSRHQVWSLLKSRRAGRVTVLSTHYMDEADILADRKAVISQGQLKCVGSSLYLKIKCGVGYHLSEACDAEKITSLVKQHVPKAKLSRHHEAELTFTLPFESMDTFPGLFSELDSQPRLGIVNYGVSMTTLEDVFLRLEAEAEVDQAGECQADDECDTASLDDTDQRLLTFSDTKSDVVTGHALWRQQFSTVAWLHMLNMRRERKAFIYTDKNRLIFSTKDLARKEGKKEMFSGTVRISGHTVTFLTYFSSLLCFVLGVLSPLQIKCRSTLRISGLVPSAYWCGQAAVDIPFYYLILSFIAVSQTLFLCNTTHIPAMILFTYVSSFGFTRVQSNRDFFSVISMMVRLKHVILKKPGAAVSSSFFLLLPSSSSFLLLPLSSSFFFLFLLPSSSFFLLLLPSSSFLLLPSSSSSSFFLFLFLLSFSFLCSSHDNKNKPVVVVSNLKKQYKGRREGFSLSKKRKLATKNVSFCVRKGEVLGLLGPNGAGKSTIMHMLAGDTDPTAGQVLMGDYSTEFRSVDNPLEHVGYCPQVNPLWPRVTLQEHLEIYAAIKGLKGEDVVVNALELKDHLHKQAKTLSAGLKRKLCFALSMIGNPQIVLLDEPSSGMDPKSKQRMWRAMRAAFKNRQRGAILTTHYMEEAEAVCDRVAIMVSGQLRCIGSIQHLKGKYGRGYSLEVKLREELTGLQQVALLHKEILRIFPHAARQESFATLMVYKIPMEDVQSLAKSFSQLESAKQTFNFEEYNFSQSTLEQVFMEFAKEQENEEDEVGSLSTTFQWQRLPCEVNAYLLTCLKRHGTAL